MEENYSELNTDGLKRKAVKGAGITVVTQLIGFLFRTASVIVLARLLEPKDFGLVAMVTAFSLLPMNFGFNGFTEFIIRKQIISKMEINAIFWVHVFSASFLAFCFIGFGFFLVQFYSEPALASIAAAMAMSFILTAFYTTHRALLRRDMKFTSLAIGDLSAGILSIVFAIMAAIGGMSYWAIVIRQLSSSFVQVIVAWILCSWRPGLPRNLSTAWPGFKYAFKVFSNFAIGYLRRSIDKILLGKFGGSALLGSYDRAYYLTSMPANQLLRPLNSVALATLSRLQNDKKRYVIYYTKAVSMVSFIGTIAAFLLMLSAKDIVPLLLGSGWTETSLILMAFCPGITATLIYGTHSWLHLSLGTPGRWLRWNILSTIVTAITFIVVAPHGAVAMAAAYSAVTYILVLPCLWYAGRPVELRIAALLNCIWPHFAAGVFISVLWLYLPAYWSYFNFMLMGLRPLGRIIMTVSVTPIIYIATVIILQRNFSSIHEVISLLKLMLSRSRKTA